MRNLRDMAPVIAFLEEYGNQWSAISDCVRIYDHPVHTTLRLIRGEQDVVISLDQADYQVYVTASSRIASETKEEWIDTLGKVGRPLFTLAQFLQVRYPDEYKSSAKGLRRSVSRFRLDQVQRFLQVNHDLIDRFIRSQFTE